MGEIDHYLLRYGKEHTIENMSNEVRMADGQTMEYEIASLTEGTWYFAIRTVDVNGLESAWSNVVSKTVSRYQ
ncbi:fibronectin type III domain-containing protein [Marinobacter fuscus]|uniref:Fibronectin type III domain-containing protein n=2 Tax=Marinobacter fuscus TaxID=2109942 RepID=A0A2T1K3U0_9GAMM|nr:fibronectin type III domain-containing protein [Marinobacter fuscus]